MRKPLYRAGLIVGLAGAIVLTLFIFAISEGRFSWYSVPIVILFVLPLLAIMVIAWKWQPMPLATLALVILPVSLLPLASGILFLLSWRAKEAK